MEGCCTCGKVHYRLDDTFLVVHACHCTWCQRETGSAFALNGVIETHRLAVTKGAPEEIDTPTASGKGQIVVRCPDCHVALWSHYGGRRRLAFVRTGTLADTHAVKPDVHIFTSTKQGWLALSEDVPVYAEYYRRRDIWSPAAIARAEAVRGRDERTG